MKIYVDDGLVLQKKTLTGIGWYTQNLIESYQKLEHEVQAPSYPKYFAKLPSVIKRILYMYYFSKKNNVQKKSDFIHYTNFYCPPYKKSIISATTIHDLTMYKFPETLPVLYRKYIKKSVENTVKYSDIIFVPSYAVKKELEELFPYVNQKVSVVFSEVRETLYNINTKQSISSILKSKDNILPFYFLYVGVVEKRKNIPILLEAFNSFSIHNPDAKLFLVGKKGFGYDDFKEKIHQNKQIHLLNYVDENELTQLYENAGAIVFPSLYEGFGKPVVEAMFFKKNIIASNIPTNVELHKRHGYKLHLFSKENATELSNIMDELYNCKTSEPVNYPHLDLYHPINIANMHIEAVKQFKTNEER